MSILWALLLLVVLASCWVLTLLGAPGNWLMIAAVALYAWLVPGASPQDVSWPVVAAMVVLATLGEVIEMLAGAAGAAKVGGSRRGAVFALAGSLVGGMVGLFIATPIPVVGQAVAALLLAAAGALAGAMFGELSAGRTMHQSWRIGRAAFWGRLLGTLAKSLVASVMLALAAAALVF